MFIDRQGRLGSVPVREAVTGVSAEGKKAQKKSVGGAWDQTTTVK